MRAYPRSSSGGFDAWKHLDDGRGRTWVLVVDDRFDFPDGYEMGLHQSDRELPFSSWDALAAWAAQHHGVTGWRYIAKFDLYEPDPDGADVPCGRDISRDVGRSTSFSSCARRRKPGEDACGQHLAVDRRAAEREAKREADRERSEAGERIADDAVAALAAHSVKARVHYHVPHGTGMGSYTGEVRVHAEDVLALLRRLDRYRDLLGVDVDEMDGGDTHG